MSSTISYKSGWVHCDHDGKISYQIEHNRYYVKSIQAAKLAITRYEKSEKIHFTRINSDGNGNPRYVVHFLQLLRPEESRNYDLSGRYEIAIKRANSIGGRKFHNKQYGGGIVFSSYNLPDLLKHINDITGRNFGGYILD